MFNNFRYLLNLFGFERDQSMTRKWEGVKDVKGSGSFYDTILVFSQNFRRNKTAAQTYFPY